jgi:pyruvate formate lyase activating enzyme
MLLLKYGNAVCGEVRKADFLAYFNRPIETTRIVSFGSCNFHCQYCKRDGQWVDSNGNIIRASEVEDSLVFEKLEMALERGERIRLSGGDPVMHPKDSLKIAKWAMEKGQKISMAHNGSSVRFADMMLPYMDYVAIDLKGHNATEYANRAGIPLTSSANMLQSALDVQNLFAQNGILVDIRTPIFGDTTLDSLCQMAELILKNGVENKFWTLRKYNKVKHCTFLEPQGEYVSELAYQVSEKFPELPVGIKEKWKNSSFNILQGGEIILDRQTA